MKIEPFVKEVLQKYGFDERAMWDCHGTAVIYHKVLEQIATQAGITFDLPFVCNSTLDNVAISVCGSMGDQTAWSIGEASPKNNKNSYPWAMAEKRAKDRVILKLIGLHGFVYSEQEADEFKEERPDNVKGSVVKAKQAYSNFLKEIAACADSDQLTVFLRSEPSEVLMRRFRAVIPEWVDGGEEPGLDEIIASKEKSFDI